MGFASLARVRGKKAPNSHPALIWRIKRKHRTLKPKPPISFSSSAVPRGSISLLTSTPLTPYLRIKVPRRSSLFCRSLQFLGFSCFSPPFCLLLLGYLFIPLYFDLALLYWIKAMHLLVLLLYHWKNHVLWLAWGAVVLEIEGFDMLVYWKKVFWIEGVW